MQPLFYYRVRNTFSYFGTTYLKSLESSNIIPYLRKLVSELVILFPLIFSVTVDRIWIKLRMVSNRLLFNQREATYL